MRKYPVFIFLFMCSVSYTDIGAQQTPHFLEKLTTEEGLGSNKVNDIVQDDNGFLWIATSDGLNRFDGTEVVQFHQQVNANSISHNYVYCLKKLPGNYLAIGTQSGLSFYNSTTGMFQNFYYRQNDTLDEYNNAIIRLEMDDKGNLWAGSKNCIFIFDRSRQLKKVISSRFTGVEIEKQRQKFVEKIVTLPGGHALLYLYKGWYICTAGTYEITPLQNSIFRHRLNYLLDTCRRKAINNSEYFPASNFYKVFDRYFLIISPCTDSLFLFDDLGKQISSSFFPYNKYPYIFWSQQISELDSTGLLISFHTYGVAYIPGVWQKDKPSSQQPSASLLESNEYGNALKDRQGNLWLATPEEGLQKISPHKQYFKSGSLFNPASDMPVKYDVNFVTRLDNRLLIATYGEGFFESDLITGKQQQHDLTRITNNTWANFVWNIRPVSADTLWIGTQAGLFWYCLSAKKCGHLTDYPGRPALLDSVAITTQFVDSHGLVWLGLGRGNGVCSFDKKNHRFTWYPGSKPNGYPLRYPIDIAEDNQSNLWFVNDASSTLVNWTRNTGQFKSWSLPLVSQKQSGNLHSVLCEADSVVWMGSLTGGLVKFDRNANSFTVYGHDKGLINSHISSMYKGHNEKLWVVTDGGLSCFNSKAETFTNYTARDGLPVKFPTAHFYFDVEQKRLYNGGKGMFFSFDPDSINAIYPPQKTVITAMLVNGVRYPFEEKTARLSSKQNDITINYTAVDLTNGPATRYAYKLVGEDTGWIMAGNQRQINFSHLAPGNYTFMVHASNSNGVWSDEAASIIFSIRPPFTKTAWFYGLILLIIGGIFYAMYYFRLKQLRQSENIRNEISQNLHDEVGSALTNISLSSLLAQKQVKHDGTVNKLLDRIYQDSQQVSEAMREIVWSINPKIDTVGDALPRMLRYASELLEAKNIELRADMAPEIERVKLSMQERRDLYLIFKEAVNNMAKHSGATESTINFQLAANSIVMVISDNGKGFDTTLPQDSNGLKNMQDRAKHHHWHLDIRSAAGTGTTLTLKAQIA